MQILEYMLMHNANDACMQDLVPVAIEGTKNVMNAAADMGVQRVVFTSSYGADHMNPNRNPDRTVDESCWSDLEFCKQTHTQVHYFYYCE